MGGPTQNLGPIGSAVLTFIGCKRAEKRTTAQTDKQSIYNYTDPEPFSIQIYRFYL